MRALAVGHAQRHLFVVKGDHIDFELQTGDFLGFDPLHLTDAMRRIDDVIANREIVTALAHGETLSKILVRH